MNKIFNFFIQLYKNHIVCEIAGTNAKVLFYEEIMNMKHDSFDRLALMQARVRLAKLKAKLENINEKIS